MALDPLTAGLDLGKALVSLGSEFIEDKDKRNEFAFKVTEMTSAFSTELLRSKTVPWVDALIKFVLATKGIYRPIGAFISLLLWVWLKTKGIEINTAIEVALVGQGPAWGWSRHREKQENIQAKERYELAKVPALPERQWSDPYGEDG